MSTRFLLTHKPFYYVIPTTTCSSFSRSAARRICMYCLQDRRQTSPELLRPKPELDRSGTPEMALGPQLVPRAARRQGEGDATTVMLVPGAKVGRPIDLSAWNDEERMKKELVAWAKAVAAMAIRSFRHVQNEDCGRT
ncbi:hypothetical protein BHM03_00062123 [Ensete ventricosum]|uniref:Uncharacterized protein n=1 Tax=Ensete ventricosum TaxID=4639 RepID=A0A426YRI4_ENSVE|nr:hypothetical protein B296_00044021 [Ensete ventricosum]RZS28523.1 hypothetical protein BHM03_00062123 [Ensete ventricosum]